MSRTMMYDKAAQEPQCANKPNAMRKRKTWCCQQSIQRRPKCTLKRLANRKSMLPGGTSLSSGLVILSYPSSKGGQGCKLDACSLAATNLSSSDKATSSSTSIDNHDCYHRKIPKTADFHLLLSQPLHKARLNRPEWLPCLARTPS